MGKEIDYKLKKEYRAHGDYRKAVRFEYEYRDASGQWWQAYGNENSEFDANGFMKKRFAHNNHVKIDFSQRKFE